MCALKQPAERTAGEQEKIWQIRKPWVEGEKGPVTDKLACRQAKAKWMKQLLGFCPDKSTETGEKRVGLKTSTLTHEPTKELRWVGKVEGPGLALLSPYDSSRNN